MTDQNIDFDALGREYINLAAAADNIRDRMEAIKATFYLNLAIGRHDLDDGIRVTITPNRRLDKKKFAENYPPRSNPDMYRQEVDTKAARAHLGDDAYNALTVEQRPRTVISAA